MTSGTTLTTLVVSWTAGRLPSNAITLTYVGDNLTDTYIAAVIVFVSAGFIYVRSLFVCFYHKDWDVKTFNKHYWWCVVKKIQYLYVAASVVLPHDAYTARMYSAACAMARCQSISHRSILYLNIWFSTITLPLAYPTLCCNGIRLYFQ